MALWQWKTSVLLQNIYQAATVISDERTLSMNSDSLQAQNNKLHRADGVQVCDTAGEKQSGTCLYGINNGTWGLTVERHY